MIADDSVLLRKGLELLLVDAGHEVVGRASDGPTCVAVALEQRPDIVIVDVRMPPSHTDDGLRAAVEIRSAWPEARILVLSQYVESSYAEELLATGTEGIGYLLKDRVADVPQFLARLNDVAAGGSALDPDVVTQLLNRRRSDDPVAALSPREREVLALMAEGCTNAAIAASLVISEGAIEKHTQRIFAKLGLAPDLGRHRRVTAVLTYLRS